MSRYKLAVFDWNGTLIEDVHANLMGSNAQFLALGMPEISLERYRETVDFPILHLFTRNGVDTDTFLKNLELLKSTFMDVYDVEQEKSPLRDGTVELLDALLDRDISLMILSNHIQSHLEYQMATRHVQEKFKHICGNPEFIAQQATSLNKLSRLQKVLDESGYDPRDAFIIGDSLEEPEIAKHLGMTAISVTWGCFSRERLEKGGADLIIDDLSDVIPFLEKEVG